jgi:hypothetical protein
MDEAEFWLGVEARKQTAGVLTHEDYESIEEFTQSLPQQRHSIKHGKG